MSANDGKYQDHGGADLIVENDSMLAGDEVTMSKLEQRHIHVCTCTSNSRYENVRAGNNPESSRTLSEWCGAPDKRTTLIRGQPSVEITLCF